MAILVTGAAGFIGFHTTLALLDAGHEVIGVDNMNDYYEVSLKESRLEKIRAHKNAKHFHFRPHSIADLGAMTELTRAHEQNIDFIIHLAAQAGVRYSLQNPFAYVESNLTGHVVMLELARNLPKLQQFIYASSSSVYGGNTKQPFAITDRTDTPVSLYAATKKADELMTHSYAHLYDIPATGLRFFTVYGEYGRPDMAYFSFTKDILSGKPIRVFNHGDLKRDFTYVDDIVRGILACMKLPTTPHHNLYNLGNNQPVPVMDFIRTLEDALGQKAELVMEGMQPGDVKETYADISESTRDLGYLPTTSITEGLPRFVKWYKDYYKV